MAAFSFIQKSREIKSRTEVQGHRIFFSEGKERYGRMSAAQENCSVAVSTEIASIELCQPQSNPHPKGVWTYSGDAPVYPEKREIKIGG